MPDWTRKAAISRTKKRINKMRGAIIAGTVDIAGDWSDQDQYICGLCDEFAAAMSEQIAKLSEALEEDAEEKS